MLFVCVYSVSDLYCWTSKCADWCVFYLAATPVCKAVFGLRVTDIFNVV